MIHKNNGIHTVSRREEEEETAITFQDCYTLQEDTKYHTNSFRAKESTDQIEPFIAKQFKNNSNLQNTY
jgi:hypothetical protein